MNRPWDRCAAVAVDRGHGPPVRRLAPEAVAVKFLRHLTTVVLVVAVIVGLGMLWAHASGGGTGIGRPEHAAPPEVVLRMQQIKAGAIRVQFGGIAGRGVPPCTVRDEAPGGG